MSARELLKASQEAEARRRNVQVKSPRGAVGRRPYQTNTTASLEPPLVPQRSTTLRPPKESPKLSQKNRRKQQHQIYKERFTKSGEVPPGGQGGDLDLIELQQPSGHVVDEAREKGGKGRGRGRGKGGSVNLSYVRGRDSNQGRGRGKK
eukprot:scaffold72036_cov40-Cyclotella_meneghiniana.AAC.2